MQSIVEAISYFREHGFKAYHFSHPVDDTIRVCGRTVVCDGVAVDQHLFLVFPNDEEWIVRDCNWQVEIDERFSSLAEAAFALVRHFTDWQADDGKSTWLGLAKHERQG